jgi:nickel-dependent lactate racemase
MVGRGVLARYRVINHTAHDPDSLEVVGALPDGPPLALNRDYVRADRRIILGFIEPHFMAGFSGGYKAVFPGVAGIDAIMHYHRAAVIADPRSTWGVLDGNPTQEQVRAAGAVLPVDFCVNVTLNREHAITGFFCGETLAAHAAGCAFARRTAMVACTRRYAVVITTNGGYPLDQNLYQAVKGMSAAAQIARDGAAILCAARCNDGFPDHGNFRKLLFDHDSPGALLRTILAPGFSLYDQWEAQLLAMIRQRCRVLLYSELPPGDVRRAHLEPVAALQETLDALVADTPGEEVAVLPEGPMTIPYVDAAADAG